MSDFGLTESVALARAALAGGPEVVLAVVIEAPAVPELVGRRLAWDGVRTWGSLGDPAADQAATRLLSETGGTACHHLAGFTLYAERVAPPPELVIVGAGHIAQPLAAIGKLLGDRVTVLDDRPDYARRERFPGVDRVLVVDFDDPFDGVAVGSRTRIVLVTRGHKHDFDCLVALANEGAEPAYLGMIGSRRRVRATLDQLAREGVDPQWIARIHAPIGLDLGGETPGEIAVAIAAEIILRTRGGSGRELDAVADLLRLVGKSAIAGKGAP